MVYNNAWTIHLEKKVLTITQIAPLYISTWPRVTFCLTPWPLDHVTWFMDSPLGFNSLFKSDLRDFRRVLREKLEVRHTQIAIPWGPDRAKNLLIKWHLTYSKYYYYCVLLEKLSKKYISIHYTFCPGRPGWNNKCSWLGMGIGYGRKLYNVVKLICYGLDQGLRPGWRELSGYKVRFSVCC